jgi:hypothetical protein
VALQLPDAARPVPAELRTTHALPRLRRRTPQRPDRGREREACTSFAGPRSWQNLAAAMIEAPGRHGPFDPRWRTNGPELARPQRRPDVDRGRARPHARSSGIPRIRAGTSFTVVGHVPIASVS